MRFFTLRNKDYFGGDVTISEDGRFIVIAERPIAPITGYKVIDTELGTVVRGDFKSLLEAQQSTEKSREEVNGDGAGK